MLKRQENKFTMYNAVNKILEENSGITGLIQEFRENQIALTAKCDEIKQVDDRKKTATIGKTLSKLNAREKAITKCISIGAGLFAYAKKNNNIDLKELTDINRSRLEVMRDTELVETLESVYNIAEARSDEGGPFGFGEADLESYHREIQAYNNAFGLSQMGTLKRKVAVKALPQLFNEADGILEVIDKYVSGMRNTNPDFVNHYNDSRVIKNLGLRHRKEDDAPARPGDNMSQNQTTAVTNETNAPPVTG